MWGEGVSVWVCVCVWPTAPHRYRFLVVFVFTREDPYAVSNELHRGGWKLQCWVRMSICSRHMFDVLSASLLSVLFLAVMFIAFWYAGAITHSPSSPPSPPTTATSPSVRPIYRPYYHLTNTSATIVPIPGHTPPPPTHAPRYYETAPDGAFVIIFFLAPCCSLSILWRLMVAACSKAAKTKEHSSELHR